ncbi:MAG: hypothetical protein AAFQ82_01080 [Myxococcota bacterium]
MKEKLEKLLAEYGVVAVVLWFTIFGLTLVGFALAIQNGFEVESAAGTAGVWGAAYVATQLTKPIRIAVTLVLTPIVGRLWRRGGSAQESAGPEPSDEDTP